MQRRQASAKDRARYTADLPVRSDSVVRRPRIQTAGRGLRSDKVQESAGSIPEASQKLRNGPRRARQFLIQVCDHRWLACWLGPGQVIQTTSCACSRIIYHEPLKRRGASYHCYHCLRLSVLALAVCASVEEALIPFRFKLTRFISNLPPVRASSKPSVHICQAIRGAFWGDGW